MKRYALLALLSNLEKSVLREEIKELIVEDSIIFSGRLIHSISWYLCDEVHFCWRIRK